MTSSKHSITPMRKVGATSARVAIRQQGRDPEKDEESNYKWKRVKKGFRNAGRDKSGR